MANIHPTAIVDRNALLEDDVEVGPYCVIGPGAVIGKGTVLHNNVTIQGDVRIGIGNQIYSNCVIGGPPQDLSYGGAPTWVIIGNNNVLREACTIHRATTKEVGVTSVGSNCYLMAGVHVGHDAHVGNQVMIANNSLLAGHVRVKDFAGISGGCAIHQFVTVGSYSFVGGLSRVTTDVPPYMLVEGVPSEIRCVNLTGLKRRGFDNESMRAIMAAHRLLYRNRVTSTLAREELKRTNNFLPCVEHLFEFVEEQHLGKRGRGREGRRAA